MRHETPTDAIFNEVKEAAKKIWKENYSDEFGYVTEKIDKIDSITNISDNCAVFYRMFDMHNQRKLTSVISEESVKYLHNNC
jgi:hypothetical protein